MSEAFSTSGESSDITAGPAPQLQGIFVPGIDNAFAQDGFGRVTPWGGGGTARRYGAYGITPGISRQTTQLRDLANNLIPAEGGSAFSFEGLVGPQGPIGLRGPRGLPGVIGITSLPSGYVLPVNTNFVAELPHNIDKINDLGTAANKLVYTDSLTTVMDAIAAEDLTTGTTDGDTLPDVAEYEWETTDWEERTITFSPAIDIVEGNLYAIVMTADGDGDGGYAYIASVRPGTYTGGFVYEQEDAETEWGEYRTGMGSDTQSIGFVTVSDEYDIEPATAWPDFFPYLGCGILNDGAGNSYRKAMVFTATASYSLSTIDFWMARQYDDAPGNLTFSIRNVDLLYSEATWAEADLTSAGRDLLGDATAADQATTLGLGTGDSPQFTAIELGHASDTTITRVSAGVIAVEGTNVMMVGAAPTAHTIASHSDTSATGANLNTLVGGGDVGALHTHAAAYQPLDTGLTSLAGLTYASDSFIKVTAEDTYAIRTIAETKSDLSLNLVENTAHSTDAHTMTIDGRDVSVDGAKLDGIEALADVTSSNETSHADVVVDGDFGSNGILNRTGAGAYSILAIGTDVQAYDAGLLSLAGLTYASDSFIKVTAEDTYAIRTIAETKSDLSLNLVENTAHSTDAHTMTIDGRDVSVDGAKLDGIEALADVTGTAETSHADVVVDGDFASNGILNRTGAGAYSILALGTDVQAYHANLAAIAGGTWTGAASITTLGTIATGTWQSTDVGIAYGGTGQSTAQAAIDALSAVAGGGNEHVLTKDTVTGNAVWKAAGGGAHVHDGDTLQLDGVNSNGGAFGFTTSGVVTFNQNVVAANYTAANLLTACATNAGELDFTGSSKKLDVEDNAVVDQDYSGDASPSFANLSLSTGELTVGSINRGAGTLLLEIGGTAEVSISSTESTFGGNLVIPNSGYIGSVGDTDAFQIEADGDIVMSQDLAISGTVSGSSTGAFEGASVTIGKASTTTGTLILHDSNSANTITLTVPDISAGSLSFTLPPTDGDNTNVLQTDGNGVLTWAAAGGGATFLSLTDTPANYTDDANKVVTVAAGENALEFTSLSGNTGFSSMCSVYRNGAQAITTGTSTKVQLDTEDYDTDGEFDNAVNYRFQPDSTGYYHVSAAAELSTPADQKTFLVMIYKNGVQWKATNEICGASTTLLTPISCDMYLLDTDYIELWVWHNHGANRNIGANGRRTFMDVHRYAGTTGVNDKVGIDSGATAGYLGAASNDGVLRTGGGLSYTDGGDFVTLAVSGGYVDRGGVSVSDFDEGDSPVDATWTDLDLGPGGLAIVPAGISAVALFLRVKDDIVSKYLSVRKNGQVAASPGNVGVVMSEVANIANFNNVVIGCDSSGVIEYYVTAGMDEFDITVTGWFL